MTRLNLVLLVAVMASALYLVHTQYESRRLFTQLDRAVSESRRLETEHQRLQVSSMNGHSRRCRPCMKARAGVRNWPLPKEPPGAYCVL